MAKRFADSNRFQKPFYRNLPAAYKLLWEYIHSDCDCAGIWLVEPDIAHIRIGKELKFDLKTALELFNSDETRIIEVKKNKVWFLTEFLSFQYGKLNKNSSIFKGILTRLQTYGLENEAYKLLENNNPLSNPLLNPLSNPLDNSCANPCATLTIRDKDKYKDKDKDLDKDKVQVKEKEKEKENEKEENPELELEEDDNNAKKPSSKEITTEVIKLFRECCPSLPSPTRLSEQRLKCTPTRVHEIGGIEKVRELLMRVEASSFLSGRSGKFQATYDWIFCTKNNWVKIADGNYDDRDTANGMRVGQIIHNNNDTDKLRF